MDFNAFLDGFALVIEPHNLLYCLIGVLIGMVIGVLPGLGPAATIAILLPITYTIDGKQYVAVMGGQGTVVGGRGGEPAGPPVPPRLYVYALDAAPR
jgi:TctA family transporter